MSAITSKSCDRQELLEKVYAAAIKIMAGCGTEEDYRLECKFYTFLTDKLSDTDWDRLAKIIGG